MIRANRKKFLGRIGEAAHVGRVFSVDSGYAACGGHRRATGAVSRAYRVNTGT